MARRLATSVFSASVNVILSMYGSWLPSVSTAQKYGLRSIDQVGVLMGETVFQGVIVGTSGLSAQLYLFLR